MLTSEQKKLLREEVVKMPKEYKMGFLKWMIRILKTDPMAPWPEEGKA